MSRKLKVQKKDNIFRECLLVTEAIEKLNAAVVQHNKTCEPKDREGNSYIWSYTTNHTIDSAPYYYMIWQAGSSGAARPIYKGLCEPLQKYVQLLIKRLK